LSITKAFLGFAFLKQITSLRLVRCYDFEANKSAAINGLTFPGLQWNAIRDQDILMMSYLAE